MVRRWLLAMLFIICGSILFGQVKTIDFYITQGISNNPLLKDLNNQIRINSFDSLLIKANRVPKVAFSGTLYYAPIIHDYGYSEAVTNGGIFSTLMNVSQDIFTGKTVQAQFTKLEIQNLSLANTGKITEKDLKKAIIFQYLNVFFLSRELSSSSELLKSMEDEDVILKQLTEKGLYRQTEYLSFVLEHQSQQLIYHETNSQIRKEFSQLNQLCGIRDTTSAELTLPVIEPNLHENPGMSPLFLRFRIDSLSLQNERTLLDRNYKPKISWSTDAGILNNVPGDIYKNFGIGLGMNFSLPVYDGNQRKLNYQKLKTSEETRKNYQDYFKQQYDVQLQQLKDDLIRTKSMIPEIEKQITTSSLLLTTERELLRKGNLPVSEYVVAIKNFITIKRSLNQYQKKILEITTEINYWSQ